jgi:hypothetical protein
MGGQARPARRLATFDERGKVPQASRHFELSAGIPHDEKLR